MVLKNKTVQKYISSLLIFSILLPSIVLFLGPKQAHAQNPIGVPVNDFTLQAHGWKAIAAEVLRQFLMTVVRKVLDKMTQSTINWINSGFHGSPLYVENPGSFFKDIAKSEVKNLVDTFGYDSLRFPFGKQFALNTIDSYKRQLEDNAQYTLSKVINDPVLLARYRTDFNVGGWNGFLINTQYPQNNYVGFQMIANEELARKLEGTSQTAAQKVNTVLEQGMGFLSPQTCPSNPNYPAATNPYNKPTFKDTRPYNPPPEPTVYGFEGQDSPEYQKWIADKKAYDDKFYADRNKLAADFKTKYDCPGGLVNTTPGSLVASQIFSAMSSKQRQGELGAALGNSLAAIFDALVNKFMSVGLNKLSDTINPPPDPKDNVDDFEYFGDTVKSATTKSNEPPPQGSPLGTCSTAYQIIPDLTANECTAQGGTWAPNDTQ